LGTAVLSFAQVPSGSKNNATEAGGQTVSDKAVNAGNQFCPVSGEKISDADGSGMAPATYEYEGKIYNFCCTSCIEDFKKEPEKYIKKVEEELANKTTEKSE
jgi:YHS domain-containing protein